MAYNNMLQAIYDQQLALMVHLKIVETDKCGDPIPLKSEQLNQLLLLMSRAIIHEAIEVDNELPWKTWEKEPKVVDYDHVEEELIDILHFVMESFIALGMSPRDILEAYSAKNKVNHERAKTEFDPFPEE